MKIEDSFIVGAAPGVVWTAITDPHVIAGCLPGCEEIEALSAKSYRATIRVELGVIKTRFKIEVELTEEVPPRFVRCQTRGDEGGLASRLQADSVLFLEPLGPDETKVSYTSDVSITGRLGKFGLGIMKKKAESLGRDFADNFRSRIAKAAA